MIRPFVEDLEEARIQRTCNALAEVLAKVNASLRADQQRRFYSGGGVLTCDCSCHRGMGIPGDCVHCRVLG